MVDHFHLVRGANTALDSVRRERQRDHGRRRPKGARRSGKGASWRQGPLPGQTAPARGARTAHRARAAPALRAVRARAPNRRGLGAQAGVPLDLSRPGPPPGGAPTRPLPPSGRARTARGLHRPRRRRPALARRTARLPRRADHKPLRRRSHQQDQTDQAPRPRTAQLRRPPRARAPSVRPNGTTRRHPARSTRTEFSTGCVVSFRLSACPVRAVASEARSRVWAAAG